MSRRGTWVTVIGICIWVWGAAAGGQTAARILRVEHLSIRATDAQGTSPRAGTVMGKFRDVRSQATGEMFQVFWMPGEGGAPTGTTIRFEYVQERHPAVQRLEVKYPFAVQGQRRAVFSIAERAYEKGGRVTAWRTQVVYGTQTLTERKSGGWH